MTSKQIPRQLQRLVPDASYHWEVIQAGPNEIKVMFPSKAELDRMKVFGTFKVFNSSCELKVDSWLSKMEPAMLLPQYWMRMEGIPPKHKGDFLALWSLGTLFGKPFKIDMPFTRRTGVLRILVGCVDHTKVPKDLPVFIKDGFYYLRFMVETPMVNGSDDEDMDDANDDLDEDQDKEMEEDNTPDLEKGTDSGQGAPPVEKCSDNLVKKVLRTMGKRTQTTRRWCRVWFSRLWLKNQWCLREHACLLLVLRLLKIVHGIWRIH